MFISIAYADTNSSVIINIISSDCTPSWSCSSWGACQSNSLQTRTCTDTNNCNDLSTQPSLSQGCTCTSSGGGGSSHSSSGGTTYQYCGGKLCGLNSYCINNTCIKLWVNPSLVNQTPVVVCPTQECPACQECATCATCSEPEKLDNGLFCNKNDDCKSGYCNSEPWQIMGACSKERNTCQDKPAEASLSIFSSTTSKFFLWFGLLVLALILAYWLLARNINGKKIELNEAQQAVYDYLNQHQHQYPIKRLKQRVFENGFSKKDIKIAEKRLRQDGY